MNVREKYNNTINRIEELSLKGDKDLQTIAQIVAQENALSIRDMITLFNYFMEMTFKRLIFSVFQGTLVKLIFRETATTDGIHIWDGMLSY